MYPIAAGIVVQTRELWDELNRSLQNLSVRLLFELSELPPDWAGFLDRIERVRPDVIVLDVTRLREPLEDVIKRIRSTAAQPAVFALNTTAEPAAILDAGRFRPSSNGSAGVAVGLRRKGWPAGSVSR